MLAIYQDINMEPISSMLSLEALSWYLRLASVYVLLLPKNAFVVARGCAFDLCSSSVHSMASFRKFLHSTPQCICVRRAKSNRKSNTLIHKFCPRTCARSHKQCCSPSKWQVHTLNAYGRSVLVVIKQIFSSDRFLKLVPTISSQFEDIATQFPCTAKPAKI